MVEDDDIPATFHDGVNWRRIKALGTVPRVVNRIIGGMSRMSHVEGFRSAVDVTLSAR